MELKLQIELKRNENTKKDNIHVKLDGINFEELEAIEFLTHCMSTYIPELIKEIKAKYKKGD